MSVELLPLLLLLQLLQIINAAVHLYMRLLHILSEINKEIRGIIEDKIVKVGIRCIRKWKYIDVNIGYKYE